MIGEDYQDSVLTDDEADVIKMINGLEAQAANLQQPVKKAQKEGVLYGLGAASSVTLFFFENGQAHHNLEKGTYISIAAAMAVGGLTQIVRKLRMTKQIGQKIRRADELRHELDPEGLGLFDDALYYTVEDK
ncbi:MAG TPA: hypothetical protein VFH37_02750 [Candidatus Saccharimonadales bacterium]|nr:hypothetical protein [Candidatus Saccharimonadales bacterium]